MLKYKEIQEKWFEGMHGKGWNSQFLNNHDHTRQVTRYGNDGEYREQSAKLLATMVHTLPGTPYIFQGEEIGMTGVDFDSIEAYQDIAMKNKYKEEVEKGKDPDEVLESLKPLSRDNSRTPVQWNDSKNAGFTDGEPWIAVNPNHKDINVENALDDPESIFYYYQNLIALRKDHDVMVYGDYEDLSAGDERLYMYRRSFENTSWLIMLNHSNEDYELALPESVSKAELVIANYEVAQGITADERITLRPHEARVYQLNQ